MTERRHATAGLLPDLAAKPLAVVGDDVRAVELIGGVVTRLRGELGGAPGPFVIQGWTGSVMPHWIPDHVDHVEPIEDDEALAMTQRLASEEGIFAGISTGANVVGAHRLAERLGSTAVLVSLAVDTGFKYMSVSPYAEFV